MRREYRLDPAYVVERRIGAAAAPPAKALDSETWGKFATLPPGETSDEERIEGRRFIARLTMLNAHGCTGKGCPRRKSHQADREVRDLLLDVLKLGGIEEHEADIRREALRLAGEAG